MTPLGRGLYTFTEAAALTHLTPSRVREWFSGHSSAHKPIFASDYKPINGNYAISFYDLIDVYVAGRLRNHGVSLQTLRKVYSKMTRDLGADHPYCRKELLTDGKIVFMRNVDEEGKEQLKEVLTDQGVFVEVVLPFLKQIDYDEAKLLAKRWRIATSIIVDPEICFGAPIVEGTGVPSAILAAAYQANRQNAHMVANWYKVSPKHVIAAAEFENQLAA